MRRRGQPRRTPSGIPKGTHVNRAMASMKAKQDEEIAHRPLDEFSAPSAEQLTKAAKTRKPGSGRKFNPDLHLKHYEASLAQAKAHHASMTDALNNFDFQGARDSLKRHNFHMKNAISRAEKAFTGTK